MPYNTQGQWILPASAENWDDDTTDETVLKTLIDSGDLQSGQTLKDLFGFSGKVKEGWERKSWEEDLTPQERAEILRHYADDEYYKGGRSLKAEWGIQYEREWPDSDALYSDEFSNTTAKYKALLGSRYDIDYEYYNENLAYRSTVDKVFGEDSFRAPFTTPRQISIAEEQLRSPDYDWDEGWVKTWAMPYNDGEIEAQEDFKKHNTTRHFDSKNNITTYLNPQDTRSLSTKLYNARRAGNFSKLKEPGSPQFINVIANEVPKEQYKPDGTRIVTDLDIRQIYQRYWGRDYNSSEAGVGITQSEIDHWLTTIDENGWDYHTFEKTIANAPEAKAPGVMDKGKAYFNPNANREGEIRNKLTAEPAPINPPDLTIKSLHKGVRRPTNLGSEFSLSDNT
tara:strand:- start:295 stop:1482 length:1188 start_codon:yes stop_codon:yes gene_type:complete